MGLNGSSGEDRREIKERLRAEVTRATIEAHIRILGKKAGFRSPFVFCCEGEFLDYFVTLHGRALCILIVSSTSPFESI